jgi:hypothetical protein
MEIEKVIDVLYRGTSQEHFPCSFCGRKDLKKVVLVCDGKVHVDEEPEEYYCSEVPVTMCESCLERAAGAIRGPHALRLRMGLIEVPS